MECLALADLGTSIISCHFRVERFLTFHTKSNVHDNRTSGSFDLTTIGIAKDVNVKVGVFQFPADFVVVDFEPDPRVPLILGRCFLKTSRALIDVYEGELTLRVGNEAITYNLDQTSRYSVNYNDMTANRIDVVELACKEYSQEVLGFSDMIASGNPTPYYDLIVSNSSPTLTPFGDSDFLLLEEADAFLALADDPTSPEVDESYYDPEGDILIIEEKKKIYIELLKVILHNLRNKEIICQKSERNLNFVKPKLPNLQLGTYLRFIKDFSKISRPMTHLLEKNTPFIFSEECIQAFQTLKKKLTEAPILIAPNWDQPFELMCDASDYAIGAVLGQRIEKHFRPIHYASKMMTKAESNYTTTEKEMLAVVYAFEKFRSYLIMNKSIVYTDHSALKYLFAKKDAKGRFLSGFYSSSGIHLK
ncbi:reverse transcriptase domain-containing protein [Tanacetum coccineum]